MAETVVQELATPPEAKLGPEALAKIRKRRSLALAWALFLFVALVFVVTIARLGGNVLNSP